MLTTKCLAACAVAALLSSNGVALANDVVIAGGRVIDPETGLDAIRNVAIEGDKIVAISEFPLEGDVVIDATGHVVSPGFIDLHAHGQTIGDYRMYVMQGVTTALELESGVLPIGASIVVTQELRARAAALSPSLASRSMTGARNPTPPTAEANKDRVGRVPLATKQLLPRMDNTT